VVTVSKLAFDTQAAAAAKKELDAAAADKRRADLFNMGKIGGLIVLIALALFLAVRRSRKEERTPVDLGELPVYRDEPAALEGAPLAMAVTSASAAPALPPAPANALVASNLQARNEIGQLIEQQPDEVARLLRGWLVDRRP
jgi:flagellar M-ring protein FliF